MQEPAASNIPLLIVEDYEPCGDCGFDHIYEPQEAMRAHAFLAILAKVPVINGCAIELDSWEVLVDGTLTYRFAVDSDAIRRERLSSAEIHELTAERIATAGQWHWAT